MSNKTKKPKHVRDTTKRKEDTDCKNDEFNNYLKEREI